MKPLALILFLSLTFNVSAQLTKRQAKDTLIWNAGVPLSKDDFQSKRSMYGRTVPAYTSSGIYLYQSAENGNYIVEAIFMKSQSYMAKESPYILKHEQLHFDLTELYARRLRQAIAQKDFTRVKDAAAEIRKIYGKIAAEWQKEEKRYDKETQHGVNTSRQHQWNEQVAARLKELEQYASTEVNMAR